jgi:glutamyl-tRNA synthetase
MTVKVRFAPSPTGVPHVGNIRTALFNYFFAKATGGIFILRLEDTDQSRKIEGTEEIIQNSLTWLGISWDEYIVQSERLADYKKFADELVEKGLAKEEDGAVRFIVPQGDTTSWIDKVGNKKVEFQNSDVEDFIILKTDGYPTYHFANVIDDHASQITHVIRGEDWIPSTPKHIMLYKAFGWEPPIFVHVPNILGTDGKKLSKRRGAKSVLDFKKEGFLPEALLNYLMLLGWSPKDDREILTIDEIIKSFLLEHINSAPATFDETKLLWMNGMYIRQTQNSELKAQILDFDPTLEKEIPEELFLGFVEIAKTRIKTLNEFKGLVMPYVSKDKKSTNESLSKLYDKVEKISDWKKEVIGEELKQGLTEQNLRFPDLYKILTGEKQGLPLAEVFEILGKERTLELLQ